MSITPRLRSDQMLKSNEIYLGDCLDIMELIDDKSIDMILTDLPYGITACRWDCVIPLDKLWKQYKRITKPSAIIVLFGSQPFSSLLIGSNIDGFKYEWIWEKEQGTNQNLCKVMPLKKHENILVFQNMEYQEFADYIRASRLKKGLTQRDVDKLVGTSTACSWWEGRNGNIQLPSQKTYDKLKSVLELSDLFDELIYKQRYIPQMIVGKPYIDKRIKVQQYDPIIGVQFDKKSIINDGNRYPTSILKYNRDTKNRLHPTQKPVALLEYLINTYTVDGDLVLDSCCGSGSTCIAAMNTNRNYIGIEKEEKYYEIAKQRVDDVSKIPKLF